MVQKLRLAEQKVAEAQAADRDQENAMLKALEQERLRQMQEEEEAEAAECAAIEAEQKR